MKKAALLVVPLMLVILGLAARRAAARAWDGFVSYRTPFALEPADAAPTEPLSPQVVLVLVDGLGLAPSRGLPFLDELRARGADYDCTIGLPSLSLPSRAVMLTGAWPDVHGQITNHNPRRLAVDHLFAAARRRDLATGLSAGPNIQTMFAPDVSLPSVLGETPETAPLDVYLQALRGQGDAARDLISRSPALAVVEMYAVDDAGHGWGSASAEYRQAIAAAEDEVRRIASGLDLTRTTLIVTGDHGHVPTGGHGGPEPPVMEVPLVLAGRGVKAGVRGTARQVDLAPTIAALLGIAVPAANQGRPLVDALDTDSARKLAILQSAIAQRERFVHEYARTVHRLGPAASAAAEAARTVVPAPADATAAGARLDALDAEEARAKRRRMELEERSRRGPAAVLALLPWIVLAGLWAAKIAPTGEFRRAAVAAAIAFVLYHVALPAAGLAYSISAINKDEWVGRFFGKDMVLGTAAGVLAALVAVWPARDAPLVERARRVWLAAAVLAALFMAKIALVFWHNGVFLRWHVPDQYWGFGFYLDVLALMALGLSAPALLLLAWMAGAVAPRPAALSRAG